MEDNGTISVKEAAREMHCTVTCVYQLLWGNRLEGARKEGKQWRIPASTIRQRISNDRHERHRQTD
jgi:excisionase family DNA binding protein